MSNYSPSLQEFAYPIPICESKADLGNILNIFQHLSCKMLAIPDRSEGWRVVTAEDLLSVVAQSWLENVDLNNYSSSGRTQLSPACLLLPSLKIPLRATKLYQVELNLNEFLQRQEADSLQNDEICLLVNRQGELQGRLDLHKIIQYLASRSPKPNSKLPTYINYLGSLIDTFSLPSKIETDRGQIIYANQQWHALESENRSILKTEASLSVNDTNLDRMTKRWIESQRLPSATSTGQAFTFGRELIQSDRSENSNSTHNFNLPWKERTTDSIESDRSRAKIQISCESDWNYLTIPLANPKGASELYSLVLATPTIQTSQLPGNSNLSSPEQSTAHILNAVSHELKSPLTGIVGLSSLLKEQQLGSLNQRQVRYVELIHRSGKKMMRTIEELLQLNILTANRSTETELINLEFLCRQLYQAILTKTEPLDSNSSPHTTIQPQFSIESGCEIALANKSLLSSIVSHLMLEAIDGLQNFKQLQIQIANRVNKTVAIIITSQGTASITNAGFNLTIAEYLAAAIGATVNNCTTADRCQLTLLLPKDKIQFLHPAPEQPPASASEAPKKLTILCLYPELEVVDPSISPDRNLNFDLKSCSDSSRLSSGYQHRIIEADSIDQAHNLARIWRLDAIILNGYQIANPSLYLRSLQTYSHLASLPLITLDTRTTEAANQIEGLNVFPCLLPSPCRSIEDLIQVIQIAIES